MYGQGNFAQFGQGPHTSMPPPQQRLPPPPPPPFQQGPPPPHPAIVQPGPPSVPPHAGQPAPPAYLQVHGPVHQGPPVPIPPGGMLNSGQSYLNLPPPRQMHGSNPMAHSYSTAQQNFQWTQNVHHIQPPAPPPLGPPATGPEMPHPPPAHRGLPPPPSQGPVLYRGLVHPPPSGGVQGLQHSLPPPPPPPPLTSSFFIPAPFGSFMQSAPQDSHMPSMGLQPPPPPPSSPPPGPPPLPPSSPPPTSPPPSLGASSSAPLLTDVELPHQSESGLSSNNHSGFVVMATDSVDRLLASHQTSDDASRHGDLSNHKGGTDCEVRSLVEHGLPSAANLKLDIPPPPHKPTEEKIVRKIEILCQYIAKNGPEFEDKIRQKEFGNPEFEFLFGGEPGSEAASAHEYFVWMKKKCSLDCKLHEEQQHGDSPLSPPRNDYSLQSDCLMDACVSSSPAASDMEMEDDITQPDEEQHIYKSFESKNQESDLISNEADTKEQLHAPQNTSEHSPAKYAVSGNLFCSGSSGSVDHGEGPNLYLDHDPSTSGGSLTMVDSSVMDPVEASEFPLDSNVEKSSLCPHEDLSHSISSAPVVSSVNVPSQLIKGTSPFRLLQDYASDDSSENEDEPCLEDVHPATVSASVKTGATSLDGEMGSDFQTDPGSKGLSESENEFRPLLESVGTFSLDMPAKSLESSIELEGVVRKTDPTSIAAGKTDQLVDNSHGNQESVDSGISHKACQQKNVLGGGDVNATSESDMSQKEDVKCMSAQLKVDEFGRLVREGASDSDSDDLHHNKKRGKRGRSWSRSPSPHDRTRRSSWRRKEKRSRSRSWSPKRRRSRSKSPFRRAGEFGGDKTRRDKVQLPDCFDFRRGKCYRGALCRYMHHDSEKSDGSRRYKSKLQYEEVAPSSKSSGKSVNEHDEVESQEMQLYQDLPKSSFGAPKDENIYQKEVVVTARNAEQLFISDQDGKSLVTAMAESERALEVSDLVLETQGMKEESVEPTIHLPENESSLEVGKNVILVDSFAVPPVIDADAGKLPTDTSHDISYSLENSGIQQSQANLSDPVLQNADYQPQQVDKSSASNSSPMQTSATNQNQLSVSEPHSNQISPMQLYSGTGSMSKPKSSENISSQSVTARESSPHIPRHHSQLPLPPPPPPPPPPVSLGIYAPFPPQLPSDFNIMQPTVNYPSHTASVENYSSYQAPFLYQHSHFSAPPNSSWNSLPPPPPPPPPSHPPFVNDLSVNAATASHGVPSLQFQQHQPPPRNDFPSQTFVRPYPAELPTHSQVSEFQHRAYPPMHEPDRPLSHMEDLRPSTLPLINPRTQQFGGPSLVGEDRFTRLPTQGFFSSNSFAQGNMQPQPLPFSRESPLRRMQSFSGDNLPPGELRTPQSHPYLQQPSYGLQRPASDSVSTQLGESGKMNSTSSRYSSDFLDRNQPSRMSEFGGSRISNYYNPYASTFDQPLSSKFGSNIFNQEKDTPYSNKYGSPFSLSQVPIDGQGVGNLGSRNMTSSTNSARAVERILPRSSDDQYDPLFDSIEPSSNSFRKSDHGQKREATDDSDSMLKRSGSNKPQDVEENNKQKEAGPVAITTSLDNEEYGETADAEVGAVENGSPSDPIDVAITGAGDVEIDQVKTPGKSKKSKDSRSMKLFKVALADFVKEVLKPSWRQGNMSKEAFKTIVKKTVDKVSGAMKNHQIPKSQAKITQYIDSSQRKLTKLVMGYVDKYVKV